MKFSSYVSPKCEVRSSALGGQGVFARERIEPEELVSVWVGPLILKSELDLLYETDPEYASKTITIHQGIHLGSVRIGGEYVEAELFNHSCDPNIGIRGQIVLLARKVILPDEEICFDYDTTEVNTPEPHFVCQCGAPWCRGLIHGKGWQDSDFLTRNQDWLSWNVAEHVRRFGDKPI